ncbi:MAG: tripartite tricarboxylate transporter TctB family protein [Betaproteobacteria bacterium]|nr:MAG: tripartite tricarboxylate transporter TctB family protein [Betaproteobacteria bacterium]
MARADVVGGLLLAAGFGAALWEASSFQYGTEFAPGPGFAPVWISAIGIAISLVIAFGALRSARRLGPEAQPDEPAPGKGGLFRVGATLIALVVMIAIVPWLGFVSSVFVFLLFLTLGVQRLSLLAGVGASAGTVLFVYVVFVRLLEVPIPSGPLGF